MKIVWSLFDGSGIMGLPWAIHGYQVYCFNADSANHGEYFIKADHPNLHYVNQWIDPQFAIKQEILGTPLPSIIFGFPDCTLFAQNGSQHDRDDAELQYALASLEADAIAVRARWKDEGSGHGDWKYYNIAHRDALMADETRECELIYTAPPVPVVPAALPENDDEDGHDIDYLEPSEVYALGRTAGWNACRVAMIQSGNFRENKNSSTNNFREIAETSSNYPVIPSDVLSAILKVAKIRADFDDFDGDRRGIGDCLDEAEQELIVTINKYASQLAAEPIATNENRWIAKLTGSKKK